MSDLWVFGYGSLMWRPGFPFEEAVGARLFGAHRSLCVYSWVHRGTEAQPGLVLGLDHGGSCRGMAFRVAPGDWDGVVAYLRERELVTGVYREVRRPVILEAPGRLAVNALAYVVDRGHQQYAGNVEPGRLLDMVAAGQGVSGANRDYVLSTFDHLQTMGIGDPQLLWLSQRLRDQAADTT